MRIPITSLYLTAVIALLPACSHAQLNPSPRVVESRKDSNLPVAPAQQIDPTSQATRVKIETAPHGPPPKFLVKKCKSVDGKVDFIAGTENNEVTFHDVKNVKDATLQVVDGKLTVPARVPGLSVNYVANSIRVVIAPEANNRYLLVWNDRGVRSDGRIDGDEFPFSVASNSEGSPFVMHVETKCTEASQPD